MNTKNTLFIISIVIFVVSAVCKMYFCSSMAVKSSELNELFNKRVVLEKEVSKLKFEDSQLSTMKYIEQKAKELGLISMEKALLALNIDDPVKVATLSR